VEAILYNLNAVFSISSFLTLYYWISDVCLSLPSVVDRDEVERVLKLKLNEVEMKGLLDSTRVLKGIIPELGL
jgi:L-lactate dehydrogenase